ncbi:MAG: antitoxin [Candidatus Asgardarchaeia archaeon]
MNIKYHDDIRRFLEKRNREEKMKHIMKKIEAIRKQIEKTDKNTAAEFIREDRDGEWV